MNADLEILLVANCLQQRHELFNCLQRPWWKIQALESGEALNTYIRGATPDLVLLDTEFPGLDADALIERLRENFPSAGIVLLTTSISPLDRAKGYRLGADVFITKPIASDELLAVVERLERRLQRSENHYYVLERVAGNLKTPDQRSCKLTTSEQRLIEALALSGSKLASPEYLLANMANDPNQALLSKTALAALISRLRTKSKTELNIENLVRATRRRGYKLTVPLQLR